MTPLSIIIISALYALVGYAIAYTAEETVEKKLEESYVNINMKWIVLIVIFFFWFPMILLAAFSKSDEK